MRVRFLSRVVTMMMVAALMASAQEPVKSKLTPRIMTATRQVMIFTNLEIQLLEAVKKKDKAALQALASDDLGIEMPNADRLAVDDWLESVLAKDYVLKNFGVRQVSVSDSGDTAIVKFDRLVEATYKGAADNGEFFVVDLWKKNGDNWKLVGRYVSKISSVLPKAAPRPTGKE